MHGFNSRVSSFQLIGRDVKRSMWEDLQGVDMGAWLFVSGRKVVSIIWVSMICFDAYMMS